MFDTVNRLISRVGVEQDDNKIKVSGINGTLLARDLANGWHTSRIPDYMFNKLNWSSAEFYSFFAPDVAYTLESLLSDKRQYSHYRHYRKLLDELKTNTWLSQIDDEHLKGPINFEKLKDLTVTLLGHQFEYLEMYNKLVPRYNLKGHLLAAAPGAGKTINSLALSYCAEPDTIIVVSPSNAVIDVWEKTVQTLFKDAKSYWHSMQGEDPGKGKYIYILHYEYLDKFLEHARHLNLGKSSIIVDECHHFNTKDSQRTLSLLELHRVLKTVSILWMSGTPIKAMGGECIPLLRAIDPLFKKNIEDRFAAIFGKNTLRANDILRARMGFISHVIPKDIFMNDKPIEQDIKVKLPHGKMYTMESIRDKVKAFVEERTHYYKQNKAKYEKDFMDALNYFEATLGSYPVALAEYQTYLRNIKIIKAGYDPVQHKEIALWCNKYEKNVIIPALDKSMKEPFRQAKSVVKYVQLKIIGEALGQVFGKMREQCQIDMVEFTDYASVIDNAVKKTLIFTSHISVVKAVDEKLKKQGYKPMLVFADTNKDLPAIVKRFTEDPDANPLIATYLSLSTAVPLLAANTTILTNQPFRPHEKEQVIARTWRIGQNTQTYVINTLLDTDGEPNINTRSKDIMEWSKEMVESIMGIKQVDESIALECVPLSPDDTEMLGNLALLKPSYLTW